MSRAVIISESELETYFPVLTCISRYKDGGQKSVFRAKHPQYGEIALKIVSPDMGFDRVEREISVMKRLSLINVPMIFETGYFSHASERLFFMFEQFVSGVSLRDKYAAIKMTKREAVCLLNAMLETIVSLEANHIIHRDIKPDNILVDNDGQYWLIDFGAARDLDNKTLTMTGHCAPLTPGYAAPEQFKAELKGQLNSRADLFALGVTLYEMLSGSHPFIQSGYGAYDVLHSTIARTADTLDIPGDEHGELAGFIKTLMQKNPSFRPPSAKWALTIFKGLEV